MGYTHNKRIRAFRQTIGAFVYHDLRKSNDAIILVYTRTVVTSSATVYPETEQ